ncbi:hypothetical protein K2173_010098 [Erythroxylum novogranatense]|uniref:Uncharacterized protein n=1 Tax=Erythroxylum novogranatense TaxID=1862640 RepID=A0AAV8SC90_9ROSI|nr:hypothetical protein K2173_010098 [Erythroxylum novogranatense]
MLEIILCILCSFIFTKWFLVFMHMLRYGFAYSNYFFIENNVSITFRNLFGSLLCDYKILD